MADGLKRAVAAAHATQLSEEDRDILRCLVTQPEGVRPIWVAEHLGRKYGAGWASLRLRSLTRKGLVINPSKGWYVITDTGREAVK